jgi:2-polyprenyl-3-methyl-5-hydroxy-6-metoxy-1,4-benzoquinol methylase
MKLYKQETKQIIYQTQIEDPFFNYVTQIIFSKITNHNGRLIDLGCGSGRNVVIAAKMGLDAVGYDLAKESIVVAKDYAKHLNLDKKTKFIQGDINKINPNILGKFDYCILQEVIEHVKDYQKLIEKAYFLLKKGGILFITTPNDPSQWNMLDEYAEHVRRFQLWQVRKALNKFTILKLYTIGFPFHRLILTAYSAILKITKHKHEAKTFRKNVLFRNFYYIMGNVVMQIDNVFSRLPWGTTIIAIVRK